MAGSSYQEDGQVCQENSHCGVVALLGRPNVGKSTLLNRILEQKISIVSHKAQTTRQRVLGIFSRPGFQAVFADTPGIMQPHNKLQEYMVQASMRAVSGADLSLVIVDATGQSHPEDKSLFERLATLRGRRLLAINKIDLVEQKNLLLPRIAEYSAAGLFEEIIPVSALTGQGVDLLLDKIAANLPQGQFLYDEQQIAVQPLRFFAAELIRETLYEMLHEELPYATAVGIEEYREHSEKGRKTYIQALIYAERDSQKAIIIGRAGSMLKRIGRAARVKIEEMAGEPVYLELRVKVMEKWRANQSFLRMVGYTKDN
ncbi:MAG: GTPase Era [Gemmatimonadota bacterium]|nr:GTPase Era [Gemmatimonadota bacterium]